MSSPAGACLSARCTSLAVLMAALLLGVAAAYCGSGPVSGSAGPTAERWSAPLAAIARALTLPIDAPGPADVRWAMLPLIAGLTLLAHALGWLGVGGSTPVPPPLDAAVGSRWQRLWRAARCAPLWLCFTAVVLLAALASAARNHTLDLSRGWIIQFLAGAGWAALLASATPRDAAGRMTAVALAVAALVNALGLWHRHQTGLQYFLWPVGALTATANLAALALATAATWLVVRAVDARPTATPAATARRWQTIAPLAAAFLALVLAGAVVWLAERRAALLGAASSILLVAAAYTVATGGSRRMRRLAFIAAIILLVAAGAWVWRQAASADPRLAGSISYRLVYWRESLRLIAEHPLLGTGPDTFAARMTPRLALRRAAAPHRFHGNIDSEAHNEWLQAAVELGIPAALAYLLIPLAALVAGLASLRHLPVDRRPAVAALSAGLLCIVVTESASVGLRGPIVPAWYWTWLGLLAAASALPRSPATPARAATCSGARFGLMQNPLPVAVSFVLLFAATDELRTMRRHARGRRALPMNTAILEAARGRWGFAAWLAAERDAAYAWLAAAHAAGPAHTTPPARSPGLADESVRRWRELSRRFPGLLDHQLRLAQSLLLAGQRDAARSELLDYLRHVAPFDPEANVLLAREFAADPPQRLTALCRGLRQSALTDEILSIARAAFDALDHDPNWPARLRRDAAPFTNPAESLPVDAEPEIQRLEAARLVAQGRLAGAIAAQRTAAEQYRAWFEADAPQRRGHDAERDAWARLAEWTFAADPRDATGACDAVEQAERFALLGMPHESVRPTVADPEFFGDRVVPTSTPPELRSFWRLSAKLRLAAGRDRWLDFRILLCLPESRQTLDAANREIAAVARELVDTFQRLPPADRPPYFAAIDRLAHDASPTPGR